MTSPALSWPASLPPAPFVGVQYQPGANATAIPVEAGEILTRLRFTGETARIPVTMVLTTVQARTLLDFFRNDVRETLPFTWKDPLTGDNVEMIFEGPPQFQSVATDLWQTSFVVITKPVAPTTSP